MSWNDFIHGKKREQDTCKARAESQFQDLSPEQLQELAIELSWGCGMMPFCGCPDWIWHL